MSTCAPTPQTARSEHPSVATWVQAPEQRCRTQHRPQGGGQTSTESVRIQIHGNGVKAIHVARGVVDGVVDLDGIGAAIGQRQEGFPGSVCRGEN